MYGNWENQQEDYSKFDVGIAEFGSNVETSHVEKVLRPIIEQKARSLNVRYQDVETHLKAGSSTNPIGRYNLRSSKTNAFQKVREENILAVTNGHNRNVEKAIINCLREYEISANDKRDRGQKPPFVEMTGNVFYYLVEKQPATSAPTLAEPSAATPMKVGFEIDIIDYLKEFDKKTGRGVCKSCTKPVSWSRKHLASHKRANCQNVTPEEKEMFKNNPSAAATKRTTKK